MKDNSFVLGFRKFCVNVLGFIAGGIIASKIKNNWTSQTIGQAVGMLGAMYLNDKADELEKQKHQKVGSNEQNSAVELNYRTDHAEQLKSKKLSQSNSIQI